MFDEYRKRMDMLGGSIRDSIRQQTTQISESLFSNSTSIRKVIMDGEVIEAKVMTDSKTTIRGGNGNHLIEFRDGVNPPAGTYVQIPDNEDKYDYWLIIYESDDLSFRKHIIKKCNYFLRWKNSKGDIVERWAVFDDSAKLSDPEFNANNNKIILSRSSKNLILPCDSETINIRHDKRFLIDHPDIEGNPDAWIVTNRNVISKTFDDFNGVIELTLKGQHFNHITDSKAEMIADFYKEIDIDQATDITSELSCKITYNGTSELKMGTPFKVYTAEFYHFGELIDDETAVWSLNIADENQDNYTYIAEGNQFKIKCQYDNALIGSHIRLIATNEDNTCSAELPIKVVSSI